MVSYKSQRCIHYKSKNKENDDIEAGFVPMANISDGFSNHFSFETKKWETIKSGFTHFSDGDIAVAKISPCLENRKSMVLSNLPNGIGAGTTELHVFRPLCVTQLYGLYFLNRITSSISALVLSMVLSVNKGLEKIL